MALREAVEDAWIVFPDGAPVAWLERRTGAVSGYRIAGPDLMPAVMEQGRRAGLRHFLFGSTPDVIGLLESQLRKLIPGVEIVGAHAPAIDEEHSPESLAYIRSTRPNIIWIALGAPRQELWMHRHASELEPALLLGVGAAFDFLAGTKSRAPRSLQDTGFEWLHRLLSEPARLGPRYLKANSAFVLLACRHLAARRR